jgi:hypothetical protein
MGRERNLAGGLEYRSKRETEILKGETPVRMLLNVSIPHEPFNTAVHSDAAGRTMPRFISVRFVDSHFAQWYCDAVEGITAHPSLVDFPARTEFHHLR